MAVEESSVPRHGPALTAAFVVGLLLVFAGQRLVGEPGLTRTLLDGLGAALCAGALVMRILSRGRAPAPAAKVEGLVSILYGVGIVGLGLYALSTRAGMEFIGQTEGETAEQIRAVLSASWVAVLAVSVLAVVFIEIAFV